jgi:hypothetical protein
MRRAIGLVMMFIGVSWAMLGSGLIEGSVMSGQTIWAFVGGALAIGGLAVLTVRTGR